MRGTNSCLGSRTELCHSTLEAQTEMWKGWKGLLSLMLFFLLKFLFYSIHQWWIQHFILSYDAYTVSLIFWIYQSGSKLENRNLRFFFFGKRNLVLGVAYPGNRRAGKLSKDSERQLRDGLVPDTWRSGGPGARRAWPKLTRRHNHCQDTAPCCLVKCEAVPPVCLLFLFFPFFKADFILFISNVLLLEGSWLTMLYLLQVCSKVHQAYM